MGRKRAAAELLEWTVRKGLTIVGVVTDSQFPTSPTMIKAKELGLDIYTMEEIEDKINRDSEFTDLIISFLFWRKIKSPLIDAPKYGCINLHPALLPKWRGTAGYNMAILHKLDVWGSTAHYVDSSIDTGPIIKKFTFNFDYREETAFTLEEKTMNIQKELYKSVINDVVEKGKLEAQEQSLSEGIYISRNQMEEMKLIHDDDTDIDLKISAFWFPPYTGAYILINEKKYTLVNDKILKSLARKGETAII